MMDDETLDGTYASASVVIAHDGTCTRHPHILLREVGDDGYRYQKDSCPECDKEYKDQQLALRDRKRELDRKLEELGNSSTHLKDDLNTDAVCKDDIDNLRDDLVQHSSSEGKRGLSDDEANRVPPQQQMARLPVAPYLSRNNMEENGYSRPTLTLESLASQLNMMQQMQDWMLKQKETELNLLRDKVEAQQRELLQKEVEIALLKEKLKYQDSRMEQELKLLKMASQGRSSGKSKEIHIQELHVQVGSNVMDSNGEIDAQKVQAATKLATSAALEEARAAASTKHHTSKITKKSVPAIKPPPEMAPAVMKMTAVDAPAAPVAMSMQDSPKPTSQKKSPASSPKGGKMNDVAPMMAAAGVGGGDAAAMASPKDDEFEIVPHHPVDSGKEPSKQDDNDEEEEEDDFDTDNVPWSAPSLEPSKPSELKRKATPIFSQKTGPLLNQGPSNPNPNRKDPMDGSIKSLQPGEDFHSGSNALPSKKDIEPTNHFEIKELDVDDGAPPTVPITEDVTIGTFDPTSFYNRHDDDNTSVGNTIASSTYGEDRQKVVEQTLLDPYGDKGRYTGTVLRSTGMPHGSGRMVYEDDGRTYDGDWRHGRWHGYGRATFANGDSYEGEYRFDQRHGRGKYCWSDGRIYDGEFSEDKRHGKGNFQWPDGATYDGDFHQGQREGHGRYSFSDGGYYVGHWIDGRYDGFGECHWQDGRKYKGEWRAGMAHGEGIETYPDGRTRHDGQWIDDEPIRA